MARFEARESQTEVGYVKGKLRYMAPEILRDFAVSHQSDLYALGVCLYMLCTGEPLQQADGVRPSDPPETLEQSMARHGLDPALQGILERCLCPDPAGRFSSGQRLKEAPEAWLDTHGGRLGPEQVAARIAELFPGGPLEWRAEELTVALMRSELGSLEPALAPVRLWMAPLLVALLLLPLTALSSAAAVAIWLRSAPVAQSTEPPAPLALQDSLAAVFDNVERQIALGRLEEAAFTLTSLHPTAPDERDRQQALLGRLTEARAARLKDLAVHDPTAALAAARQLATERPGDPVIEALLASLSPANAVTALPSSPLASPPPSLKVPLPVPEEELLYSR